MHERDGSLNVLVALKPTSGDKLKTQEPGINVTSAERTLVTMSNIEEVDDELLEVRILGAHRLIVVPVSKRVIRWLEK